MSQMNGLSDTLEQIHTLLSLIYPPAALRNSLTRCPRYARHEHTAQFPQEDGSHATRRGPNGNMRSLAPTQTPPNRHRFSMVIKALHIAV